MLDTVTSILENDSIRGGIFLVIFALLITAERFRIFQRNPIEITNRWTTNFGLFLLASICHVIVLPQGIEIFAETQQAGVFNLLKLPMGLELILSLLFFDLWRYWEHRLFHQIPLFWRMHLVHHSDTYVDVTTTERHHPFEVLISLATMIFFVWLTGMSGIALAIYLIIASAVSFLSHANIRLPEKLERCVQFFIVTPQFHAVHHSAHQPETDSNYGAILTVWDRVFDSYVDPKNATIPQFGLNYYHLIEDSRLVRVLQLPIIYRRGMKYPKRIVDTVVNSIHPSAISKQWRFILFSIGVSLCLTLSILWPTVTDLVSLWQVEAYQYAYLIVPTFVYLIVWNFRVQMLEMIPKPGFLGVAVSAVGAFLWFVFTLLDINIGQQLALVIILQGIILSAIGCSFYKQWFPLFFLLFLMLPSGDVLTPVLRLVTVEIIDGFASLVDLSSKVQGFFVYVEDKRYVVIDDCSGFTFVILAIFLNYVFGLLLYRSFIKILLLSAVGALLGILSNAVRVCSIIWLDYIQDTQMELTEHVTFQWIALGLMLTLQFVIINKLTFTPSITENKASSDSEHSVISFKSKHLIMPYVSIFIILSLARWGTNWNANSNEIPSEENITITHWSGTDSPILWHKDKVSDIASLSLTLQQDKAKVNVLIFAPLTDSAKLPKSLLIPKSDFVWYEGKSEIRTYCAKQTCTNFIYNLWLKKNSTDKYYTLHTYSVGSENFVSRLNHRLYYGWQKILGNHVQQRLVSFSFVQEQVSIEQLNQIYLELQQQLGV